MQELFPKSSPDLVDLVSQMLEFNPHFRPTALELLGNKIFDQIRNPKIEKIKPDYKFKIKEDANELRFDYENDKNQFDEPTMIEILSECILKEIDKLK